MILTATASKPVILWFMLGMKCALAPDGNIDLLGNCLFMTGITPYLTKTQCVEGGQRFMALEIDGGGAAEQYRKFCVRRLAGPKGDPA